VRDVQLLGRAARFLRVAIHDANEPVRRIRANGGDVAMERYPAAPDGDDPDHGARLSSAET
jgi:hypothetical protein